MYHIEPPKMVNAFKEGNKKNSKKHVLGHRRGIVIACCNRNKVLEIVGNIFMRAIA